MNLTDDEMAKLKACTSEREWSDACEAIEEARQGQYPPDWFPKVLGSGLMYQITSRFGAQTGELVLVEGPGMLTSSRT